MSTIRVNTIYGADGRLRTSYFDNKAAKTARKNAKAFNKQLSKYDKDFINYASLDIDSAKINDKNTRYILGKLNIAGDYVDYLPMGDMAESLGEETTAIAGNKKAAKLGIAAKIANKFQPFFEEQARKHPKLQKLSDSITKAANNGRMPLTAESAAVMRIAFDKKYYEDSRKPGADKDALREQHAKAVENLTAMAKFDGVDENMLSKTFAGKLIEQMKVDEGLTDIYAGMATGDIRLGNDEPMLDSKGKEIKVGGKTLYKWSNEFVSPELDERGNNIKLDAWEFKPREPQSIESIVANYKAQFDAYASKCKTEADLKFMMAGDGYANIERNAKAFAEADCPDDADRFKYELARANIASCQKWGIDHGYKMPYANMIVPPPYENAVKGNKFAQNYATGDYYSIDSLHDKSVEDVKNVPEKKLAVTLEKDVQKMSADANYKSLVERLDKLEAENAELREQLKSQSDRVFESSSSETVYQGEVIEESSKSGASQLETFGNIANGISAAMNVASMIRNHYGADDNKQASVLTPALEKLLRSKQQAALPESQFEPPKYIETEIIEEKSEPKEFKTNIDDFGLDIDFKEINAITVVEDVHVSGDEWYDVESRIYYDAENDCLKRRDVCPGQPTYENEISLEDANQYINSSLHNSMLRDKTKDVYIEDDNGIRSQFDAKSAYKQHNAKEETSAPAVTVPKHLTVGTYSDNIYGDENDDDYDFG